MRWLITTHAVERLMGRADRELSPQLAHNLLAEALSRGKCQEERTISGQERWLLRVGRADVVAIVKKDPMLRCRVVVSVLRLDEAPEENLEDTTSDVLLAYQRQLAAMGALEVPVPEEGVSRKAKGTGQLLNRIAELEAALGRAQATVARQAEEQALAEVERYVASKKAAERAAQAVQADPPTEKVRRALEHAEHHRLRAERFKKNLRIAVRYLRKHNIVDGLHAIGSDDPYLTTEAFAEPERFTLEQRQEIARALHGQHEEEAVA